MKLGDEKLYLKWYAKRLTRITVQMEIQRVPVKVELVNTTIIVNVNLLTLRNYSLFLLGVIYFHY